LIAARRKVGIHAIRLETFGQVYHVAVDDPYLTASDASSLIYGSPDHRSQIAAAAGFAVPSPNSPPSSLFDPHLFGRAFDVAVDYADEHFVVRAFVTSFGTRETDLIDGARITTYPIGSSGPIQTVEYPTGYKRITYRPPKALFTLAQGLALFHVADDLTLSPSAADVATRQYEAQVIWRWAPDLPRRSGDTADTLKLTDDPNGAYISALVAPPGPRTWVQRAIDVLRLQNPIAATVGMVGAGSLLIVIVGILRRSHTRARRVRW
jgi:hypothetical protein